MSLRHLSAPGTEEDELLARLRDWVEPRLRSVRLLGSAVLALIIGGGAGAWTDRLFLFLNPQTFDVPDPLFGNDVGFYVFRLPAAPRLAGMGLQSRAGDRPGRGAAHYLNGALRLRARGGTFFSGGAKVHVSVLLAILASVPGRPLSDRCLSTALLDSFHPVLRGRVHRRLGSPACAAAADGDLGADRGRPDRQHLEEGLDPSHHCGGGLGPGGDRSRRDLPGSRRAAPGCAQRTGPPVPVHRPQPHVHPRGLRARQGGGPSICRRPDHRDRGDRRAPGRPQQHPIVGPVCPGPGQLTPGIPGVLRAGPGGCRSLHDRRRGDPGHALHPRTRRERHRRQLATAASELHPWLWGCGQLRLPHRARWPTPIPGERHPPGGDGARAGDGPAPHLFRRAPADLSLTGDRPQRRRRDRLPDRTGHLRVTPTTKGEGGVALSSIWRRIAFGLRYPRPQPGHLGTDPTRLSNPDGAKRARHRRSAGTLPRRPTATLMRWSPMAGSCG